MKVDPDLKERPEVSSEECASNALLHRIRKMRWIGMKSEAERLEIGTRRVNPAQSVLASRWFVRYTRRPRRCSFIRRMCDKRTRHRSISDRKWRPKTKTELGSIEERRR